MKLNLELKDDNIKQFVDLYNFVLSFEDEELINIFRLLMHSIVGLFVTYCLDKNLK